MFGRFLELAHRHADIAASVQFYERLGFTQLIDRRRLVASLWRAQRRPHPSGTARMRDALAGAELRAAGAGAGSARGCAAAQIEPELARLGEEELHQLRLRDPGGQAITLLEARTYSPARPPTDGAIGLRLFRASEPAADGLRASRAHSGSAPASWPCPSWTSPIRICRLTSDRLDLAFHRRRCFDAPLLVFECEDLAQQCIAARSARHRALERAAARSRSSQQCLIEAPEGTLLWCCRRRRAEPCTSRAPSAR